MTSDTPTVTAQAPRASSDHLAADTRPRTAVRDPLLDITFAQLVARQAATFPDRELLVDGERRLTYQQFLTVVTDTARSLMALGVQDGDRVAVWAPNSIDWLVTAFGASSAGATIIPMNSRFKGIEALDIVQRARPRVLFTVGDFLGVDYPGMLRAAAGPGDLDGLRIVVLDGTAAPGDMALDEFVALGAHVGVGDAEARRDAGSSDAVSDMILTSGTTGRPKATLTSHHQNMLAYVRLARRFDLQPGERINATLPFFHSFGLKVAFLCSALLGGTCVVEATFDPDRLARLVEKERITFVPGPPTLFAGLLASPVRATTDLSSLRLCLVAGAMVPRELVERIQSELCPNVVAGYGQSELAGGIALTPAGAPAARVAGWAGRIVEGVEVRIVDDDGEDVAVGGTGEILARGECVMIGYLDDPVAQKAAVDADGWLHTGDVGLLDDEGYLRITDRKKDMFIVGGFNAYPAEIERLLMLHPGVAQAAVVGVPDQRLGEVGAAFVVASPGVELRPDEIIAWARGTMSNFKVPRRVDVIDRMPVNASMKVLKDELRARLA